jgi:uncharacterized protein (DUF2062 family)
MILSRTLARRRIAANEAPSFRAAWAPVAVDIALISLLLAALWQPVLTAIFVADLSLVWTILVLLVVIYLPFQIVVVFATIWAVRSRWIEKDTQ